MHDPGVHTTSGTTRITQHTQGIAMRENKSRIKEDGGEPSVSKRHPEPPDRPQGKNEGDEGSQDLTAAQQGTGAQLGTSSPRREEDHTVVDLTRGDGTATKRTTERAAGASNKRPRNKGGEPEATNAEGPPAKRARPDDRAGNPKRPRPAPDEGAVEGTRRGAGRRAPFQDITVRANRALDGSEESDPEPQEERTGDG
jgi:hypothetical protein